MTTDYQLPNGETPDVITTDLFSVKYNEGIGRARSILRSIIKTPAKTVIIIVPSSLLDRVPADWRREDKGQAFIEQGIEEKCWMVGYGWKAN